jgi:hypothetical protein
MKIKLLVLAIAVCMIAAPAKADLFGFHLGNLSVNYDGGNSVTTTDITGLTSGSLYRNLTPASTAQFDAASWGTAGSESLLISMTLSNLTATTADAIGTMTFVDVDGSTIAADLAGTWTGTSGLPIFTGQLTNVTHTPTTDTFDGHTGSVDMQFSDPQPWIGAIVQLVATTNWFVPDKVGFTARGGSIDVSVVPVPGAVLLGILGLGAAGLKLRKYA